MEPFDLKPGGSNHLTGGTMRKPFLSAKEAKSASLLVAILLLAILVPHDGLSHVQDTAIKSLADFWWIAEYKDLVRKLDAEKKTLWEHSYKTGANSERVVQLILLRAPDRMVLATVLPKDSYFAIDEKGSKRIPASDAPIIITIRDHDFDGIPDDFHDSFAAASEQTPKGAEITKDGFIKFKRIPDFEIYSIKWSIGIGYAVNYFLNGLNSAYPPEMLQKQRR